MGSWSDVYYYRKQEKSVTPTEMNADLVIYGATSAGAIAAVQGANMGLHVVLVEFGRHIGGMGASGLGATDIGNKQAIGGLSRTFYYQMERRYEGDPHSFDGWRFEPSAAEEVYHDWLREANVPVYYENHLASVHTQDGRIQKIVMENGNIFSGHMFIDATYEGDLMAKAGVRYHVGRESNATYKETLNGIHFGSPNHNFKAWVDPYWKPGDPSSGLVPGVIEDDLGYQGQGDNRIQAYNFRICLTKNPENRIPFPKPPNYDPTQFELLARYIEAGVWDAMQLHKPIPRQKTDLNNFGGFSTDYIGANDAWPEGDYETREKVYQDHVRYNLGMLYFLANSERVPKEIRNEVNQWGLAADEFTSTNNWPHQLYIREARRMISDVVMTEHHCRAYEVVDDPVGLAAYQMDAHNSRRVVIDGRCINEGNVEVLPTGPYPISFRAIVPKQAECSNLIVPVCVSASHIAYGSIRMEPVFMILGQSAATIAKLAIEDKCAVQHVSYEKLRQQLLADGQILDAEHIPNRPTGDER